MGVALLWVTVSFTFFSKPSTTLASSSGKPNIILFYIDDADASLFTDEALALWGPTFKTELKEKGITFRNFSPTTPLCGPSRAALLTGQYNHNNGILTNLPGGAGPVHDPLPGGFADYTAHGYDASNIGVQMQRSGYYTAYIGKYVNGYPITSGATPDDGDTDQTSTTTTATSSVPTTRKLVVEGWDDQRHSLGQYYGVTYFINGQVLRTSTSTYRTDFETQQALDIIRRNLSGAPTKPLFMIVAPFNPHEGLPKTYPDRYNSLFGSNPPFPQASKPNFNEADMTDKPSSIFGGLKVMNSALIGLQATSSLSRYRSMKAIDDMLKSVVDELAADGQLGNTYIFFTTDNGYLLGEHRFSAKQTPFVEAQNYPLFVRGPGIMPRQADFLVSNVDLYATFADIAQSRLIKQTDGRSFFSLLQNANTPLDQWRPYQLVENFSYKGQFGVMVPLDYKLLKTPTMIYVEWFNGDKEYYDLSTDPYQLNNIYNALADSRKAQLAQLMDQYRSCGPTMSCNPQIKILTPINNDALTVGSTTDITWSVTKFNNEPLRITLSGSRSSATTTIADGVPNASGVHRWTVPTNLAPGSYMLRIGIANEPLIYDEVLVRVPGLTTITLSSPVENQRLPIGSMLPVRWFTDNSNGGLLNIIGINAADNTQRSVLATKIADTGAFDYILAPGGAFFVPGRSYRVRVNEAADATINAISKTFSIVEPQLSFTSPAAAQEVSVGATLPVRWTTQDPNGDTATFDFIRASDPSQRLSVAAARPNDGVLDYIVPNDPFFVSGESYLMHVNLTHYPMFGATSSAFTVQRPAITLSSPTKGQAFAPGSTLPVRWATAHPNGDTVGIVVIDATDATKRTTIVTNLPDTGSFDYLMPNPSPFIAGRSYKIRVYLQNNVAIAASSFPFVVSN